MEAALLEKLLDVSRTMAETRELDALLDYAVAVSLHLFDAEFGYLVLLQTSGALDFRVKRDRLGNIIQQPETQISTSILWQVITEGKPVVIADALVDPIFGASRSVELLKLRSVMCVPLISRGAVIGALYVENRSRDNVFTEENLKPLQVFASQAAVAIENAMLTNALEARVEARTVELQRTNHQLHLEIAEREKAEEQLIQLAVERERMRLIADFARDASHQFRTPLAVINTNVYLMSRSSDEATRQRYLKVVTDQVNSIVRLLDSLVMMIQLDSGIPFEAQPIDLNSVARSVAITTANRVAEKQQQLALDIHTTPVIVQGSSTHIQQAVLQLVDNAIRFTPEQGVITLVTSMENDAAWIAVMDTGKGIEPRKLPMIFRRFYREDESGTMRGFGLGLAIVHKIVEKNQGYIQVESQPGRGSMFRLVFPAVS